eukprot:8982661-Pyramimonas_sp.AAC.2
MAAEVKRLKEHANLYNIPGIIKKVYNIPATQLKLNRETTRPTAGYATMFRRLQTAKSSSTARQCARVAGVLNTIVTLSNANMTSVFAGPPVPVTARVTLL